MLKEKERDREKKRRERQRNKEKERAEGREGEQERKRRERDLHILPYACFFVNICHETYLYCSVDYTLVTASNNSNK